jgi:hypothetical protein
LLRLCVVIIRARVDVTYNINIVKYIKILVLTLLMVSAAESYATPNLRGTPLPPYGPYLTGQMPLYYDLLNTGTSVPVPKDH